MSKLLCYLESTTLFTQSLFILLKLMSKTHLSIKMNNKDFSNTSKVQCQLSSEQDTPQSGSGIPWLQSKPKLLQPRHV